MKVKVLPWNKDKWNSRNGSVLPFDKLEHAITAFVVTLSLMLMGPDHANQYQVGAIVFCFTTLLGLAWEFKDGIIPYDGKHIEGLSKKDLIANTAGILLALLIYFVFIV